MFQLNIRVGGDPLYRSARPARGNFIIIKPGEGIAPSHLLGEKMLYNLPIAIIPPRLQRPVYFVELSVNEILPRKSFSPRA
jgi:hypothetical protein